MILVAVRGQADIGLLHRFAKAGRIKPVRVRSSRPLLILWSLVFPNPMGLVFVVVVSEIMLYFKLENIKSDQDLIKIINKIKQSLGKISQPSNKILAIKIQDITVNDNTMIPKLENKNL